MRIFAILLISLISLHCAHNKHTIITDITEDELYSHVAYLASDSMQGRRAGTPGDRAAAEYIRNEVIKSGLIPLADDGFQYFDVVTSVKAGPSTRLLVAGEEAILNEDFTVLAYSANDRREATVVFAGYGFEFETDSLAWNSYADVDVQGKFVLVLTGDPDPERGPSIFEAYNSMRNKVLKARDKGALGVLFVSGLKADEEDALTPMTIRQGTTSAGIQVAHIKRNLADRLLQSKELTIAALEEMISSSRKPNSFELDATVELTTAIELGEVTTQNVVALLPGNDSRLKDEYIVLGAHYDHLGMGGPGSGSRRPDTVAVHFGADDNASGVAAILEIVQKLAADRENLKRSVVFAAFGAEEMGLLGSKKFTNEPLIDLEQVTFMFNLDMVGSLNPETRAITVGGTGTAAGLSALVAQLADTAFLKINQSSEGFGPSDHASFYAKDIPVLFFFTGVTQEYHTPFDTPDRLNYPGKKVIAEYVYDLVLEMANRSEALVFQEAGPKSRDSGGGRRALRVTLGIMPDFASQNIKGLRADTVIKDRPADLAGMKSGDIIVAIEGKPVNDIYEYMARLQEFKKGQRISIDVMRGEEKLILIVEL